MKFNSTRKEDLSGTLYFCLKFCGMNNLVFTRRIDLELKYRLERYQPSDIYLLVDDNSRNFCVGLLDIGFVPLKNYIVVPGGEHNKSLENVARIWQHLSENGARRNAVLLNVGGGMISDMGGFAASCFKRGITYINIPTTLLAQVDASVGGKNGINFNGLKNEIGSFASPAAVMIDNRFLATLPERQLLSGFAEMLKHALLADEEHLAEIMCTDLSGVADEEFLALIQKSVALKDAIVTEDPWEKGLRKALNFGHTVGHAIESMAIRKSLEIYHGDAVAYGMIAELFLSVRKLGFDEKHYEAVRRFILEKYPPFVGIDEMEELYDLMLHDKKNERDGVNFTLLHAPGDFEIDQYCGRTEILEALAEIKNRKF